MKKISFLVAIHNEEKILDKTLKHLSKIPYKNYEVILGLDGCTDNSENIVKKYVKLYPKIFRYFILNERKGKHAVINKIVKKAKGKIIIINDADWKYTSEYKDGVKRLVNIFENPRMGGIAEGFPVEWDPKKINQGNLGYKMVAYGTYFWIQFQKEKLTLKKENLRYLKDPTMFLTNILRKKLYEENSSLGDDFERTKQIMDKGYDIIIFDDLKMPRMKAVYNKIPIKDLFRQKIRTAKAREQLKNKKQIKTNLVKYYKNVSCYILNHSWKEGFYVFLITSLWLIITFSGEIISKFKKPDTKKDWLLRMKR